MHPLIGPIIAAVVLLFLLALFPLNHYWIAILVMLGLIYYALFHNPMQHAHKGLDDAPKDKPKRKLKKRRTK